MHYNLDDLRIGVRNRSDEYQASKLQNQELDDAINDGIDQAQTIIFPLTEDYFVRREFKDLVAGVNRYYLPENAKSFRGIDISSDNGNTYYSLKQRDLDRRNADTGYYYSQNFPYSYYFEGDEIVLLSTITSSSTNGLRFLYVWEHHDLDEDENVAITEATRASSIVTVTTSSAHKVVEKNLVTLKGMADGTYNGTYRVISCPDPTTLTLYQDGEADSSPVGNTGVLYRKHGMDLPGGRTTKRYVEAWATRTILQRSDKDTSNIDKDITYLGERIKLNLNHRQRGRLKKIRLRGTYGDALVTPYTRRWRP